MSSTFTDARRPVTGWVGWIAFGAMMLVVTGILTAIQGLAGIFRDESYFAINGEVLVLDFTAWGWIHLVIGVALAATGIFLLRGSASAQMMAVFVITFNLVAQFAWLSAQPFWSLVVIALDVLVLYALLVHGGEVSPDTI